MTARTWLITGISTGFGHELAQQLLERADRVVGTVRRPDAVANHAEKYPDTVRVELLDATDTAAIAPLWSWRSRGCAATNCSASAGTTSTRPGPPGGSTVASSPSATTCTRPAARLATPAAASTSTPPPSKSSPPGDTGSRPNNGPSASCPWIAYSPTATAPPSTRHALWQAFERISRRAAFGSSASTTSATHASLLIAAGVPVKVVSERLGHASPTFTIETYQHVLPGMQADAAKLVEHLLTGDALLPAA
jgi:hypothetical protein